MKNQNVKVLFQKLEHYKSFLPIFYIFIVWIIFSSPYFFQGKVPFPATYQVNHFKPWSHYEKYWGPVKNGAMPDLVDQIYPWKHFTIESWKNGQVPLWNPYNFSGNPHLANFQSAAFTPFNILFFLLSFVDAWTLLIILQPLMSGLFVYFFMRELKIGRVGALISSIAFMFCGFTTVWMAYGTLSYAIAYLPLALFAIEKFYTTRKITALILLSISVFLSFFSGHFQTSLYFLLFVFSYIIFKLVQTKNFRSSASSILFIVIGFLIAMPQILPSIEFYLNSGRSNIFISGGGIPFQYLLTSFAPDFFGNPVTRNDWFGYYAEFASFIGIIPLILALFGVLKPRNGYIAFFFLMALISLILAVNSPILSIISSLKIPVISTSTPSRIIVLFSFSIAVLAGFGFEKVQKLVQKKELKKILKPILGVFILFAIVWILLLLGQVVPADKFQIAWRNLVIPTVLFAGFVGFVFLPLFINRKLFVVSIVFLVLAVSYDSLRFATKWMPTDPKELVFQNLPIISKLKEHAQYTRVYGNLGAQVETYYDIASIEGYDPLYSSRYGDFIMSATTGSFTPGERSVARLNRTSPNTDRVIDMLGVSIIFHPKADTNQGWAYPVWNDKKRFHLLYEDEKFELYHNSSAFPRAKIYFAAEQIHDPKKIVEKLYDKSFDVTNTIILEDSIGINNTKPGPKEGFTTLKKYSPNSIEVESRSTQDGVLFLSDNYYPGWKAYVDDKQTPILRANYAFRAIALPAGTHVVQFVYDPMSFKIGLLLAGLGIVLILGVLVNSKLKIFKGIYA